MGDLDAVVRRLVRDELSAVVVPSASRWMRVADSPVDARRVQAWIDAELLATCKPGRFRLVDRAQHDQLCAEHSREKQACNPAMRNVADHDDLDEAILAPRGRR